LRAGCPVIFAVLFLFQADCGWAVDEPVQLTNLTAEQASNSDRLATGLAAGQWNWITNFAEISRRPLAKPFAQPSPEADHLASRLKVGRWIWTTNYADRQSCHFWRAFTVPADKTLRSASLRITGDDFYRAQLDGQDLGMGANWRILNDYDVKLFLQPGRHVLAVEALNEDREAGVLAGLNLKFTDGTEQLIGSDRTWRIVPNGELNWQKREEAAPNWPAAREVAVIGQIPRWTEPLSIFTSAPLPPEELHFWQQAWFVVSLLMVCAVVVMMVVRQTGKLMVQNRARQMLELERARIARDIHDDLGSMLTQLVLQGEVALTAFPENSPARNQFGQLAERARGAARALDEVVWAVNSRRDTVRDFATHLCKFAETFLAATPIRCRLDVPTPLPELPFDLPVRRGLFLAVKEALNNAVKHSDATRLLLHLRVEDNQVMVSVEDNGRGFAWEQLKPERNGLNNMNERLRDLGGKFHLVSKPGTGCRVEFIVPLRYSADVSASFWKKLFGRKTRPASSSPT
jgi:signal transduction histidine kinase